MHQFNFLKALLFIMMDLTGEVSSGAVDMARSNLEKMLTLCAKPLPPEEPDEGENMRELRELQRKSLHDVIHELVRQVTSPNNHVREQGRIYSLPAGVTSRNSFSTKLRPFTLRLRQ